MAGVAAITGAVCGCPASSLHGVPATADLSSITAMKATVGKCDFRSTPDQESTRAHEPLNSELRPYDCCLFVHDATTRDAEFAAFYTNIEELRDAAKETTAGKKDLLTYVSVS
eukprot:6177873-Pleurochrysis_carterae.AAC.1